MGDARLRITGLMTEYAHEPVGIDEPRPRFSWQIVSDRRCETQSAYQVLVADDESDIALDRGTAWDSGKVDSEQSIHVEYSGKDLEATRRYFWKVRVWDSKGQPSEYSSVASFEMGLLDQSQFVASWIGADPMRPHVLDEGALFRPAPFFRRECTLAKPVRRARVYATALGVYELHLNGRRVGADVLSPGWTDYRQRVCYQTYDVTDLLVPDMNAIGAILADGWYSGHVAHVGPCVYGSNPAFYLQMHIEYVDGTLERIVTGDRWKWTYGPILYADLLRGEVYDARLELPGWNEAGYDDSSWHSATVADDAFQGRFVAQIAPPIRCVETIAPISVEKKSDTSYLVDLGQNFSGWVRIRVRGSAGSTVVLNHAEVLDASGNIYTENLRSIRQVDRYTLRSDREELYEPRFTQHGFRYVEVSCSEPFSIIDVVGCAVSASLDRTGTFECSNSLINRIYQNILWTQKANFLTVPTDCPQRDERMGWLGDAQLFAGTASLNMDTARFYTKWMADISEAQSADGAFCSVAPVVRDVPYGVPVWGDAGVIIPYTLYSVYGDTRVIERYYPAMRRWIEYLLARNEGFVGTDYGFGDWLSLDRGCETPKNLISTAYFAYVARLLSKMVSAIGLLEDSDRYEELFCKVREAFAREFVSEDGRVFGDTQTGYALALFMDLMPERLRNAAIRHLLRKLEEREWHLCTGTVGTACILSVLSSAGLDDVAYRIASAETFPSLGYMVKCGATAVWERWDGWTEERGFQDPAMNSFSHYAFGSIGKWFYESIGGVAAGAPGFRRAIVNPRLGPPIEHASTELKTMYGTVSCSWGRTQSGWEMELSIPANAFATVILPGPETATITESGTQLSDVEEIMSSRCEDGRIFLDVGSGKYQFGVAEKQS